MKLGQILYYTSPNGSLARTAVSSIAIDDGFKVLDYHLSHWQYFLEPEKAIDLARAILEERLEREADTLSPKDRRIVEERWEYLHSDKALAELISQPLVAQNVFQIFDSKEKQNEPIPEDAFPREYFVPGQKVFALITPQTHYGLTIKWHPRPYFILRCVIKETSFAPKWPGNLYYDLRDTHYRGLPHGSLCATIKEACQRMTKTFAEETCGTIEEKKIPVFSASEEKRVIDERLKQIVNQVLIRAQ